MANWQLSSRGGGSFWLSFPPSLAIAQLQNGVAHGMGKQRREDFLCPWTELSGFINGSPCKFPQLGAWVSFWQPLGHLPIMQFCTPLSPPTLKSPAADQQLFLPLPRLLQGIPGAGLSVSSTFIPQAEMCLIAPSRPLVQRPIGLGLCSCCFWWHLNVS